MPLKPITRKEQFYARIAGDSGEVLEPITRTEHFLQRIIDVSSQGGGTVTAEAVASAIGAMDSAQIAQVLEDLGAVGVFVQSLTNEQKAQARTNINAEEAQTTETVSGATPTITPTAGTAYKCDTLTSLTISNPPVTGAWSVVFTSGSTATTTTIPSTILGLESFAAEANTIYEINVLDNRAVVGSWAVSSS